MKFYFISDCYERGGIESIHQYCHYFRECGYESYIVYPFADTKDPPLYLHLYPSIQKCLMDNIEHTSDNVIILPEICDTNFIFQDSNTIRIIMWMSYEYGIKAWNVNKLNKSLHHISQSIYAIDRIKNDIDYDKQIIQYITDNTKMFS